MNQMLVELGIELDEDQIEKFKQYYRILMEWNQYMNLTAITVREEVERKHFIDSLSIVKANLDLEGKDIIDIGTGAGFPGIPIKIYQNNINLTLLDAREKRIRFLNEVINKCELENVRTIHARAEDYGKKENHREKYDISLARAVSNISTLCEYCLPYVKEGGIFVSYKSKRIEEELKKYGKGIEFLGGMIEEVVSFKLPRSEEERNLIVIRKIKPTPKKYPRQAGIPEKLPIQ